MSLRFFLIVISLIAAVFVSSEEFTNHHHFTTIGEARYRISIARLTINHKNRLLVKQFSEAANWELDLGDGDSSQEPKIQDALAALVPAEAKWDRNHMSPFSRIQWANVNRLVKRLAELIKLWPGVLIDKFALDTLKKFNKETIKVQQDQKKLKNLTDELERQWPNQGKLFDRQDELEKRLEPIESAVEHFHQALQEYLTDLKQLWHTDRVPNSTHQKRLSKALWNVQLRVAKYIYSDVMPNSNKSGSFCCPLLYYTMTSLLVAICLILCFWKQFEKNKKRGPANFDHLQLPLGTPQDDFDDY